MDAGSQAHSPPPSTAESSRPRRDAEPQRTCVGCRGRGPRSDLVRLVLDSAPGRRQASVVVDERRRAAGRGAWLHPQPACLDRALRRSSIARALRHAGPVDLEAVSTWLAEMPSVSEVIDRESGLEADGHPMSTQR